MFCFVSCVLWFFFAICRNGLKSVEIDYILFASGDVRLVDGSSPYNGRVEVYYNGVWGTVYETGADNELAEVVCRQLNLG